MKQVLHPINIEEIGYVLEFANRSDLQKVIIEKKLFSEPEIVDIMVQVLKGLKYAHE